MSDTPSLPPATLEEIRVAAQALEDADHCYTASRGGAPNEELRAYHALTRALDEFARVATSDRVLALVEQARRGAEDAALLDHLDANPGAATWSIGYGRHPGAWTYADEQSVVQLAPTLREAIAAARAGSVRGSHAE